MLEKFFVVTNDPSEDFNTFTIKAIQGLNAELDCQVLCMMEVPACDFYAFEDTSQLCHFGEFDQFGSSLPTLTSDKINSPKGISLK